MKHVAVIGGGPAGLMAAETLASSGHSVTLYDHMPTVGRKLLMAGRGGLNLTHSEPLDKFITRYGSAAEWLTPALRNYPPAALCRWCEGLGQPTFVGSSGRVFPSSMKTAPLLRAWLGRLQQLKVQFALRHQWRGWEGKELLFSTATGETKHVSADATLLAMGGASWPRLGSDGNWVTIVEKAGIALSPLRPANSGFIVPWSTYFRDRFAGHPLKPVGLTFNGITRQGEAMITAQGIEGGIIYAFSADLRETIATHNSVTIHLDLRPALTGEALTQKLQARGSKSLASHLRSTGLSPLAIALLHEVTAKDILHEATPALLATRLKALPLMLTAPTGIARAISTAGGVTRNALTDDFMLQAMPGVFAAGEMLDWEAPTGGYLLQACFSTAVAAAQGIIRFTERA